MKAVFEIEWNDDLGEGWMNEGNLLICLNTEEHCGKDLILNVKELPIQKNDYIDAEVEEIKPIELPHIEEEVL